MPQTPPESNPQLGIVLEHTPDRKPHRPGDTVSGRVYRTAAGVAPEAKVIVTLHGRSKCKITKSTGQSSQSYRSSFNCLTAPVETQVLLSRTPLHIPAGSAGESWPFAITIPPLVSDVRNEWQVKYYAAPGGTPETLFPPPATFQIQDESFIQGKEWQAFTEYYVRARIEIWHRHKGYSHTATAPFLLRNVHPGPPITEFSMRASTIQHTVSAYRLVPGVTELSFGQKTRQKLGSHKVPKLTFKVTVFLPRTLQMENTNIIPVTLVIASVSQLTSEIVQDVPQEIILKSFRLRVKPRTTVQAERHGASKSSAEVSCVPSSGAMRLLGQQICMPVTPGSGVESTPLDLGEILGIRTPERGIYPDFLTYNIVHKHELIWGLDGSVAGQDFSLSSSTYSVKILPGPGGPGEEELPGYSRGKDAPPAYSG
ncbi:hypothetical protein BDW62DRAFT_174283 [Aspergillus aurantiobrunneus]